MDKITVRLPASAANLGPGFDCIGIALDLWNETTFEISGNSLQIEINGEGNESLNRDESNLIFKAFSETLQLSKESRPAPKGLKIICRNKIPVSSGLGSSASAILTGILAANSLYGLRLSMVDILNWAMDFEGHGDNLAASFFGGLVIVYQENSVFNFQKIKVATLPVIICIPAHQLSTLESRESLPGNYKMDNVVFNISRVGLLVHALSMNNCSLFKTAMQDQIHQQYRLKLLPGAEEAIQAGYKAGASGIALSGAGPGLIAFFDRNRNPESIIDAMQTAFTAKGKESKIISTKICSSPAQIIY